MSRELPPNPNLEHLRKQAKNLLRELQQEKPTLQLSDAQHEIAKQYGFASWPKLKAHVESLRSEPAPAPIPMEASPLVGTWIANLSKSRRHPANQFQSATLQFKVTGDTVTIDDAVVDDSGHEERGRNIVQADGMERASGNGYALTVKWRDTNVLETVAKKDGKVVGWGTYEVSADGKTMTISADEQVIVLDRQ
jgi:hypothetical protein